MRWCKNLVVVLITCQVIVPQVDAAKRWYTKEDCKYIPHEGNDGDSFHVRVKNRHYIYRLYWVDTPETDRRFPERVTEQAAYWGISDQDVLTIGKKAARFTQKYLKKGFKGYTKNQNARGMSNRKRIYAQVEVNGQYLARALVEEGLARVHGFQEMHPDGPKTSTFRMRLKTAEREAKKARKGAWGKIEPEGSRFEQLNPTQPVGEQTLTLARTLPVYSLKDSKRQVGLLRAGTSIKVLRSESPAMVRIQFKASENKVYEAQCRRIDLGI